MGLVELLIVVVLLLWLFGYFGRGRFYARGPALEGGSGGNIIHVLLVIVVILILLKVLRLA